MFAFVQIVLDGSGREQNVVDELKQLPQVREAHILFGEWDVIAKLELPSPEALGTFVLTNIRSIPGVKLTSTMIVAR